jgi:hypothetical protein
VPKHSIDGADSIVPENRLNCKFFTLFA